MEAALSSVRRFLRFEAGGAALALPAEAVDEILDSVPPSLVPLLPRHLLGLIAWRGRALPVVDSVSLLDLAARGRLDRTLVVRAGDLCAALLVERVPGLEERESTEPLGALPPALPGRLATVAEGILAMDGVAAVVLDADKLLAAAAVRGA